jgi:Ala-tRNA(Pro) deacylase
MITTESSLLAFLDRHAIRYRYYAHKAVYTCAEVGEIDLDLPGTSIKNLFLQSGERQMLVVTRCDKRLNLRALGAALGLPGGRVQFGSPAALEAALGVTPGAVTILALVNDAMRAVELVIDAEIAADDSFLCHPLVNTATLALARADLLRFLAVTGHAPRTVAMQGQAVG